MKSFQFRLQRVLEWRALQLRREEEKLSTIQNQLAEVLHRDQALEVEQLNAEMKLLGQASVEGADFRALAAFQVRVRHERVALHIERTKFEDLVAAQRKLLLKARKDCKILENLKERRAKAWVQMSDKEVEETAAESYISSWVRSIAER